MCLTVPARVVAIHGQSAEVDIMGEMRATVNILYCPDVAVGQYVLVDRGLALEVIEPAEAEAIMGMYDEIGQMLSEADARVFGGVEAASHG